MISKQQLESWVLDYACKHKMHTVVSAVFRRVHRQYSALPVSDVRLSCVFLHQIIRTRDMARYPLTIETLEFIFKTCPEAITFKLYSKLITGIKMLVLLEMLRKQEKDVLDSLLLYFPQSGQHYTGVSQKQLKRMNTAQANFRKFFLSLMVNKNQCHEYFQDEYQEEFGESFHGALKTMADLLTEKIESHLPVPVIEKIMSDGVEKYRALADVCGQFEMLLGFLQQNWHPSEQGLLDLLSRASTEQDKVTVPHQLSLSYVNHRSKKDNSNNNSQNLMNTQGNICILKRNCNKHLINETHVTTRSMDTNSDLSKQNNRVVSGDSDNVQRLNCSNDEKSLGESGSLFSSHSEPSTSTSQSTPKSIQSSSLERTAPSGGNKRKFTGNSRFEHRKKVTVNQSEAVENQKEVDQIEVIVLEHDNTETENNNLKKSKDRAKHAHNTRIRSNKHNENVNVHVEKGVKVESRSLCDRGILCQHQMSDRKVDKWTKSDMVPANMMTTNSSESIQSSSESELLLRNYRQRIPPKTVRSPSYKPKNENNNSTSDQAGDSKLVPCDSEEKERESEETRYQSNEDDIERVEIPTDFEPDVFGKKRKSISDIDRAWDSEDEYRIIPPSYTEDLELMDIFFEEDKPLSQRDYLPSIVTHTRDTAVKLCIIKLFKQMDHVQGGDCFEIYA